MYRHIKGIKTMYTNFENYAAVTHNGVLYNWGRDARTLNFNLTDVDEVFTNPKSFCVKFKNNTLFVFGDLNRGGCNRCESGNGIACSGSNPSQICLTHGSASVGNEDVVTVFSNVHSFVALKSNSSIFCWGERGKGGKCDPKKNVATITSTKGAYSALLKDGSVHSWGDIEEGGCVQPQTHASAICQPQDLNNVQAIFSTRYSFAALKTNGEVVFYGKSLW